MASSRKKSPSDHPKRTTPRAARPQGQKLDKGGRKNSLYARVFDELDRAFWLEVLRRCDGNQTRAAEFAGVSYATVKFRVADMRKEQQGQLERAPLGEEARDILTAVARVALAGPDNRDAESQLRAVIMALVEEELEAVKAELFR